MAFDDTQELERSLLHILLGSQVLSRMYIVTVKEEWFTSTERKFIVRLAQEVHRSTRSLLTKQLFDYEVQKKIDVKEVDFYLSEWDLISGLTVQEDAEALIERLKEAQAGRETMDLAESVVNLLEKNNVEGAVTALKRGAMQIQMRGTDRPIVEITNYKDRLQLIKDKKAHPERYMGIKTGFQTFDKLTGGLFPKEFTLIAGLTGLGKSTFVRSLQMGIVFRNANKNVLHVANEESQEQVESKFDAMLTEIPYSDFKLATISDTDIETWTKFMDEDMKKEERGRIFIKEVPVFTDVTLVEQAFRELEGQGIKIHVVIIDHLPHIKPIERAYDPNDERAKAASDCKELARSLGVAVVCPGQAATAVEGKTKAGKLDIYGSKAQIHVANTFMIIVDKDIDESGTRQAHLRDWERDRIWLCDLKKNRDGPPFSFMAKHFVKIGKVCEWVNLEALSAVADEVDTEGIRDDSKGKEDKEEDKEKDESQVKNQAEQENESQEVSDEISQEIPASILDKIIRAKKRG